MNSLTSLTIEILELPPSPNRTRQNTHWSHRAAIDKAWRSTAYALAMQALGNVPPPRWTKASLRAVFFLPDKRHRDAPNLVGSEGMKGLIDGLVDAGVMVDDSLDHLVQYGPFDFVYRKGRPGVAVQVEGVNE